jgi:glycosyltransferase involved in cell wall biosynthesis
MRIKLGNLEDVVCLTGSVQPSEIVNHYADATIFALPCIVEENGNRDGIPM